MSNTQLFFALLGTIVALFGSQTILLKMYMDAKIDPVKSQIDFLARYVVEHSERIAKLEERTSGKKAS